MTSALPPGFFDDDAQQLVAVGVSIKKQQRLIEENVESEISSFMKEIETVVDDNNQTVIEDNEQNIKDSEEDAVQVAYMARVASLMMKSNKSSSSSSSDVGDIERETKYIVQNMLPIDEDDEAEDSYTNHQQQQQSTTSIREKVDVIAKILQDTRAAKRRKANSDDDNDSDGDGDGYASINAYDNFYAKSM